MDYGALLYELQQMVREQPEVMRAVIPRELFEWLAAHLAEIDLSDPSQINPDAMSYEQLLELEEKMGKVSRGLTNTQIKVLKKEYLNRKFLRRFT